MSDHRDEFLTEEEAAALWKRAAMLQSEAIQRAESARRESAEGALTTASTSPPEDGYALEHVRSAAIEAGISAEFLDAALTDMKAQNVMKPERPAGRLLRKFIGDQPDVITARRIIEAPPRQVLATMEELLPKDPYKLSLVDRSGDVLNGGLLTFNIEGAGWTATEGFAQTAAAADFRQVVATLTPLGDSSCELTMHGPVAWAHRTNAGIGAGLVGFGSVLGFAGGTAGGSALAAALVASGVGVAVAAAAAAAMTVGGTVLATVGGTIGFQKIYDYSIAKGQQGLDAMLAALAMKAQGGWGLSLAAEEAPPKALAEPSTPE